MCLADGVTVGAFVSCRLLLVWLVLVCVCCLLFGVRMARTVFSAIDIYLYIDGVARDCGAFSCSCGGLWLVVCMYGCIKVCFVRCGDVVYICIYIMRLWLVWWWWWSARIWIDIYNGGSLVFALVCIYKLKCYIQKSNNFHA